jgi:hypothetical protein
MYFVDGRSASFMDPDTFTSLVSCFAGMLGWKNDAIDDTPLGCTKLWVAHGYFFSNRLQR